MNNSPWKSAYLIVNAHSRNGERMFEEARDKLREAGIELTQEIAEHDPAKLDGHVRSALQRGADLIIVGGGDGTISGTIGNMEGADATFAPLPLGTANSFARTLGIGANLDDAVTAIVGGHTAMVDLGDIDGHRFANSAAIGLSPMIGDTVPHKLKRYLGRFGYLLWAIRTMIRFRPFRVDIDCDGEKLSTWATEVRMLNGRYSGGIEMSEDASVRTGEFVIHVVAGKSVMRLALDWYLRILRLRSDDKGVIDLRGRKAKISTRPRQRVAIDGEVLAKTPITFEIHPRAVRVIVPAHEALQISGDSRERVAG